MAIDYWRPGETDAWVKPPKTFYGNAIHIGHLQLRHLMSSPSHKVVYFVNRKKVFCLDTTTNTRILITELPFDAICTASGHGWFCAGGESLGYFAAVRIPDYHETEDLDGHLPDCPERPTLLEQLDAFYHALPPRVRIERLGDEIVNSISIHRLPGMDESDEDDIVAVLTNNDRTVRVYSLTRDTETYVEKFDFAMNHATISPDGTTMMVVGDKEVAYFYRRSGKSRTDRGGTRNRTGDPQHGTWVLLRQVRLHKPPHLNSSSYFTTAWSPTGKYCATASENGTVTLIDKEALEDEQRNPIITIVSSSRPDSPLGGVRAMCFAPHPWDLLAWNEDRGRMCIADLRNGLNTCQIVELDQNSSNVTKTEMLEGILTTGTHRGSDVIRYTELLSQTATQRQRQRHRNGDSVIGSELQGLTEEEQQILDGLRTTRQREEALRNVDNNTAINPRSINYSAPRRSQRHYAQEIAAPGGSNPDPWRIIEAAMQPSRPASGSNRASGPNHHDITTDDDTDEISLVPISQPNDNPSSRTRTTLSNFRPMVDTLRLDSETAYRDYRQRVAELDATSAWRTRTTDASTLDSSFQDRVDEIEAVELEAAERRHTLHETNALTLFTERATIRRRLDAELQAVNASAARLLATGLETAERELLLLNPSSRAQDLAVATAQVNAERRRRLREANLRMPITSSSARESALTTRGEAVLAREQRERERTNTSALINNDARSQAREFSLPNLRTIRRGVEELARRSRARGLRTGDANVGMGLGTTGIAWGDASTVYVGTEEGIFELKLNFEERKFWPAMERR